ncbi:MAG: NAD(P)H-dependent oxidoreductase [Pseudomonadota bacterium]
MTKILRIDASMRRQGSVTRDLADKIEERILMATKKSEVQRRDLTDAIPQIDEAWIDANFTDPDARSADQKARLGLSDELVDELRQADVVILAVPVYNFGVPAAFKAWVDQICRARETFRYTENGPVGLLQGKKAILVSASGGTEIGSAIDFTTPYVRHILGFIGITDVTIIGAGRMSIDADAALASAIEQIDEMAA